jgi:hypothetical protein
VLGPEHPATLQSMNNLAIAYIRERKYEQLLRVIQFVQSLGSAVNELECIPIGRRVWLGCCWGPDGREIARVRLWNVDSRAQSSMLAVCNSCLAGWILS